MKILEVRRHSIRQKPGDHLSQQGVTLARLVGQHLGPFERVVTSTLPRAIETAVAMGFAVDETNELLNTYGPDVERESPWPMSFAEYAVAIHHSKATGKYARKLAKYYTHLVEQLPEERAALVINHGGVVELGVVACLPDFDFSSWGGAVEHCEGARLYWNDHFIRAEELRVTL